MAVGFSETPKEEPDGVVPGLLLPTAEVCKVWLFEELSFASSVFSGMSRRDEVFFKSLGAFSKDEPRFSMPCSGCAACGLTIFVLIG
jgi:hypothetical protein